MQEYPLEREWTFDHSKSIEGYRRRSRNPLVGKKAMAISRDSAQGHPAFDAGSNDDRKNEMQSSLACRRVLRGIRWRSLKGSRPRV
jgi:hypothetical protein